MYIAQGWIMIKRAGGGRADEGEFVCLLSMAGTKSYLPR